MAKPGPNGQQPVDCDICGKTFKDRSGLTAHMRLKADGLHNPSSEVTQPYIAASQAGQTPADTQDEATVLRLKARAAELGIPYSPYMVERRTGPITRDEFEVLEDMALAEFELDDPRVQELLNRCDAHCDDNAKSIAELESRNAGRFMEQDLNTLYVKTALTELRAEFEETRTELANLRALLSGSLIITKKA